MEANFQLVKNNNANDKEPELVLRAQSGDMDAFRALYEKHLPKVYGLCLRLCADKSQAEDATQEVFVQLWQKIQHYNGHSQFSTWLHSVATNITISYMRKQKYWWQRMLNIDDSDYSEPLQEGSEGSIDSSELEALITRLPERTRIVFVLHAVEGYRHEQVAEILGVAVGTSKTQFHRARKMLEEWISE